jgi:hypothetical protein
MDDVLPIDLRALNHSRVLLGDSERVVTLWELAGRVGYLNPLDHRGAVWVWLTSDQLSSIVVYSGPAIEGSERPHFHLPAQ